MVVLPKKRTSDGVVAPVSALVGQPVLGAGQQDKTLDISVIVGVDSRDEHAAATELGDSALRVVVAHGFKSLH